VTINNKKVFEQKLILIMTEVEYNYDYNKYDWVDHNIGDYEIER